MVDVAKSVSFAFAMSVNISLLTVRIQGDFMLQIV